MSNIKVYASLIDGGLMPLIEDRSSSEIVEAFTGDDTGAPPTSVTIEVITESGKKISVNIPNSLALASVTVDGKTI